MSAPQKNKIAAFSIMVVFVLSTIGLANIAMEYFKKEMPNSGTFFLLLSIASIFLGLLLAILVHDKK